MNVDLYILRTRVCQQKTAESLDREIYLCAMSLRLNVGMKKGYARVGILLEKKGALLLNVEAEEQSRAYLKKAISSLLVRKKSSFTLRKLRFFSFARLDIPFLRQALKESSTDTGAGCRYSFLEFARFEGLANVTFDAETIS